MLLTLHQGNVQTPDLCSRKNTEFLAAGSAEQCMSLEESIVEVKTLLEHRCRIILQLGFNKIH